MLDNDSLSFLPSLKGIFFTIHFICDDFRTRFLTQIFVRFSFDFIALVCPIILMTIDDVKKVGVHVRQKRNSFTKTR